MECPNCKKKIDNDAKFCNFCGVETVPKDKMEDGSVDLYFKRKENTCQICGVYGPTKYVEFYQNVGALVMRFHKSIKGNLCKNCINQTFWRFTLITLVAGWWGIISFVITPIFIINNSWRYLFSLNLKPPEEVR